MAGRHWLSTELTKTVPSIEGNSVSRWKWAFANGTGKAVRVIGLPKSCHYLSLHKFPTAITACSIHSLVIQGAEIFSVLYEEASLSQVTATYFAGEAFDMEMPGLNPEHFTFAWFSTLVALDDRLL